MRRVGGWVELMRPCDAVEIGRAEVEIAADDNREGRARLDARNMLMLVVDVELARPSAQTVPGRRALR